MTEITVIKQRRSIDSPSVAVGYDISPLKRVVENFIVTHMGN